MPNDETIRLQAFFKWIERGCEHGHDLDDWLAAEMELGLTCDSGASQMLFIPDQDLKQRYEHWLTGFDSIFLTNWKKLLKQNSEAAMCEAGVWDLLVHHGVIVEPYDRASGVPAPDFRCQANGHRFYVETTCLTIESATNQIGVEHGTSGMQHPNFITDAISRECRNKADQCGGLDAPCLVAIGTHHDRVGPLFHKDVQIRMVLTGETNMTWDVAETGVTTGAREFAPLRNSPTVRRTKADANTLEAARKSIAGLLLVNLNKSPANAASGILHQEAAQPFNRSALPDVDFRILEIDPGGTMSVAMV